LRSDSAADAKSSISEPAPGIDSRIDGGEDEEEAETGCDADEVVGSGRGDIEEGIEFGKTDENSSPERKFEKHHTCVPKGE
jgi:hypothetical protein